MLPTEARARHDKVPMATNDNAAAIPPNADPLRILELADEPAGAENPR